MLGAFGTTIYVAMTMYHAILWYFSMCFASTLVVHPNVVGPWSNIGFSLTLAATHKRQLASADSWYHQHHHRRCRRRSSTQDCLCVQALPAHVIAAYNAHDDNTGPLNTGQNTMHGRALPHSGICSLNRLKRLQPTQKKRTQVPRRCLMADFQVNVEAWRWGIPRCKSLSCMHLGV